jgi:hypothetical protein
MKPADKPTDYINAYGDRDEYGLRPFMGAYGDGTDGQHPVFGFYLTNNFNFILDDVLNEETLQDMLLQGIQLPFEQY